MSSSDPAKSILIKNFSALSLMQIIQYLAPLIVLPYLVRVIGPARFGILSFAQSIALYFALLPDMGISLYAPREIAMIKNDKADLSRFVSGLLLLKLIILLITLFFYFLMIYFVPTFNNEAVVFILSAGYIIGEAFIPFWFFQGLETMVNFTIGIFIIRVLATVPIFFIIRQAGDYIYVPLINSCALIIGVFLMYLRIFSRDGIRFKLSGSGLIRRIVRESFPLFISNLFRNLHSGINVVILGFLAPSIIVGYYAAAERLVKVGMGLLTQLSNVFYPYTSRMLKSSRDLGISSMRTGLVAGMLLSIPATIFVVAYSEIIVSIMLGPDFIMSIASLRILGMLFIITGLSNVFGIQVLLPLGEKREYMRPIIVGFIIQFLLTLLLAQWWQGLGAALAYIIAQAMMALWMGMAVKKLSLGIISRKVFYSLLSLTIGLSAFALLSRIIGLNDFISIGLFCVVFLSLIASLRFISIRNWSIIS